MAKHNVFFLSVLIFALGIVFASLRASIFSAATTTLLIFYFLYYRGLSNFSFLSFFLPIGFLYYQIYDFWSPPSLIVPNFLNQIKDYTIFSYQQLYSPQLASLLSGLTLGDNSGFSKEFLQQLSDSGTRHLTALSGQNLFIVSILIHQFFKKALNKKISFLAATFFTVCFVLMTGSQPSAIRAAIMACLIGLSDNLERRYYPRNAIALAGFILILFSPQILIFDLGFQLSFLAVIGIVYLSPAIKKLWPINQHSFLNWQESLVTTIAAQLAVAPLIIATFHNFNLFSFVSNILILPLVPPIMILGYINAIVFYILKPAAFVMSLILAPLLRYLTFVVELFSKIKFIVDPSFNWWMISLYYLGLFILIQRYGKNSEK